jgi:uncharacterized protein (TIGR02265 family)
MLVQPDVPLSFSVDAEARFEQFPAAFCIKGMFLSRLVSLAPRGSLAMVRERLVNPTLLTRCLPFADYPQVDYSRLAHLVAVELYRQVQLAEAMRRVARHDIRTFATSQVGKILLTLAGDATACLMKLPEMYRAALRGGQVSTTRLAPDAVQIDFRDFYGWLDCYPIGTVEGLVAHFSRGCAIEVSMQSDIAATYVVRVR